MYTIPVITSTDLRREETIIQAANSLEYLHFIVNDVFSKINYRIEKNNAKIDEIQSRIEKTNTKIKSLIGSKKAIRILSPAKFPSLHVFSDIPITLDPIRNSPENFNFNNDYEVESNLEPISQSVLQDKLAFFFVTDEKQKSSLSKVLDNQKQQFGVIPRDITSVNTMLLYNTTKNVYSCIKEVYDPKDRNNMHRNEAASGHKIEAAPRSITNRQIQDNKFNQKLFYTPKLNDAPTINLPVDLPDLPGIADDVQFKIEEPDKIAPSLFIENLSNIVEICQDSIDISHIANLEDNLVIENFPDTRLAPIIVVPPPPPPPPIMQLTPSSLKITEETVSSKQESKNKINTSDARSNLMDAIRKAGGTKALKSSAASEVIVSKKINSKSEEIKKPANNLMDDLHNKLMMRRKGISGAKENVTSGTMMDKLASIIPPPPKPGVNVSSDNSSDNNDDDWDA